MEIIKVHLSLLITVIAYGAPTILLDYVDNDLNIGFKVFLAIIVLISYAYHFYYRFNTETKTKHLSAIICNLEETIIEKEKMREWDKKEISCLNKEIEKLSQELNRYKKINLPYYQLTFEDEIEEE